MKNVRLPLFALMLISMQLSAQPVITSQPVNQNVVWGGNATFSVTATDVGPLTYQWQLNGTNLPNNIITTVVGGNLFNNLPATNSILNSAAGTAMDNLGNLFIADTGQQRHPQSRTPMVWRPSSRAMAAARFPAMVARPQMQPYIFQVP